MNTVTRTQYDNLFSAEGDVRYAAFMGILNVTSEPVDWAYEVWDGLVAHLQHKDNHHRAIAAQLLCNLAKSDPEQRVLKDFDALLAVTKDERFVTARHCLQAIWKVGSAGPQQQQIVVEALANRFAECCAEKNCTLIRADIVQNFKQLFDAVQDETIRQHALALIATEPDEKYRKKYTSLWKSKSKAGSFIHRAMPSQKSKPKGENQ